MSDNNKLIIGLIVFAVVIFIIVFAFILYYSYSGQSTTSNDSNDEDITIQPRNGINNLVSKLQSNDVPIVGVKKVRTTRNLFNIFNGNNKVQNNNSKVIKNNNKQLENSIRIGLTSLDSNLREPFIAKARPTKVTKIDDTTTLFSRDKVVTYVNSSIAINDLTVNEKLFIIEATSSITLTLPKTEGITLKFWNNTTLTHTLKSSISINDDSNNNNKFTINPGQFVILESLGSLWIVTTKTNPNLDFNPVRPCDENTNQEYGMNNSIDGEFDDLLNGGWQN